MRTFECAAASSGSIRQSNAEKSGVTHSAMLDQIHESELIAQRLVNPC